MRTNVNEVVDVYKSASIAIHLGKNPARGGSPPKESIEKIIEIVNHDEFGLVFDWKKDFDEF